MAARPLERRDRPRPADLRGRRREARRERSSSSSTCARSPALHRPGPRGRRLPHGALTPDSGLVAAPRLRSPAGPSGWPRHWRMEAAMSVLVGVGARGEGRHGRRDDRRAAPATSGTPVPGRGCESVTVHRDGDQPARPCCSSSAGRPRGRRRVPRRGAPATAPSPRWARSSAVRRASATSTMPVYCDVNARPMSLKAPVSDSSANTVRVPCGVDVVAVARRTSSPPHPRPPASSAATGTMRRRFTCRTVSAASQGTKSSMIWASSTGVSPCTLWPASCDVHDRGRRAARRSSSASSLVVDDRLRAHAAHEQQRHREPGDDVPQVACGRRPRVLAVAGVAAPTWRWRA